MMPLIGMRAIGIHTVPELFRILPDGTVGSAAVPLVAVPFNTASAIVSMLFEPRVYFTQIRSLRFRPVTPLSIVTVSAVVTRAYRPSITRLRTGMSALFADCMVTAGNLPSLPCSR